MMIGFRQVGWRREIYGLIAAVGVLVWFNADVRSQAGTPQAANPAGAEQPAGQATVDLQVLVERALQEDPAVSAAAIEQLRQLGPRGVQFLLSQEELRTSPRWNAVLDTVAQQRDAQYSGLYWYTDLEQALAVAKREHKPVLSLRLLGKLTDELSCANSRFFRTTLYPNPAVRELLENRFVLHWQSVRAVPIITIELGGGRLVRRTITGNSLHLVLDELGRPIDVLPGLYASGAFVRELQLAGDVAVKLASMAGNEFQMHRSGYHADRLLALQQIWAGHCRQAQLAESLPMGIDHQTEVWTKLAPLAGPEPVLAGAAVQAVADRAPPAEVAGRLAMTKSIAEAPLMRLVRNVSRVINEDSVRNEYYLHVRIHSWFAMVGFMPEREPLVSRVYAELFLSPLNDPWYGLSHPDVFSALTNDGRIDAVTQNTGN